MWLKSILVIAVFKFILSAEIQQRLTENKVDFLQEKFETSRVLNTTVGTKTFYIGVANVNFFKAIQLCEYEGRRLATITSANENRAVDNLIRENGLNSNRFWISANDLAITGDWFWLSNGEPLVFSNWSPGEPNNGRNGTEHCAELWKGEGTELRWNDAVCSLNKYYVCEKQEKCAKQINSR